MLFDLYGDFATEGERPGSLRLGALVALGRVLGVSETAVRSAAARLVHDGWLRTERRGRESIYTLTARGRQLIEEGRRRIFSPPDATWDGTWHLVALSVPEARRDVRDRMRKALAWLGFGSPSSALYLSPHDRGREVLALAEELGAGEYVQLYRATAIWPGDPRALVSRAWADLAAVNARYAEFVRRFGPRLDAFRPSARAALSTFDGRSDAETVRQERPAASQMLARSDEQSASIVLTGAHAFRERFALANQFRKCLFGDPDLPAELLPARWQGARARALFLEYHHLVTPAAMDYFDRVAAEGPPRQHSGELRAQAGRGAEEASWHRSGEGR